MTDIPAPPRMLEIDPFYTQLPQINGLVSRDPFNIRFEPSDIGQECSACGAVVKNTGQHTFWHNQLRDWYIGIWEGITETLGRDLL